MRGQLDGLTGRVLILPSRAFGGRATALRVGAGCASWDGSQRTWPRCASIRCRRAGRGQCGPRCGYGAPGQTPGAACCARVFRGAGGARRDRDLAGGGAMTDGPIHSMIPTTALMEGERVVTELSPRPRDLLARSRLAGGGGDGARDGDPLGAWQPPCLDRRGGRARGGGWCARATSPRTSCRRAGTSPTGGFSARRPGRCGWPR